MSRTILLVDDEDDVRNLVGLMLAKEDLHLIAARSGNEALRIVQEEKVDLILLDLMMPRMSGQDLLRILKKMPSTSDLPVVILTALETKETMEECLELGATAYVQKPFAKKILVRTVKNVLGLPNRIPAAKPTPSAKKATV